MKKVCILLTFLFVMKGFAVATCNQNRLYDCAANCLYLFCSLTDNKISYSKSMELLPMTDKGNSMLEVNQALQKCGFETKVKTIKAEDLIKVKYPSIVLNYPKNKANEFGHFFVIIPHDNKITIYDYPQQVRTYPTDFLISALKQNNINEFPIVICKIKRKLEGSKNSQKTAKVGNEIIFKGFDKQLMGDLDFGNQPESSMIKCSFNLTNKSSTPIELKNIKADCRCSKIYLDETHVSPGNSCKINMDISLIKKYKDVAVRGWAKIKEVGGSESANLLMLVKGYSEPRILCVPQKVNFGNIKTNSGLAKLEGIKIIKTKFAKDQEITKIDPTTSDINIFNIEQSADSIEFDITLDSADSIGLKTSRINIFLDNEAEPANYFDVTAFLQLDFAFSPKVVIVKKEQESVVTITPKEKMFTIEKVLLDDNSDYFNISFSNETNYSLIYVSIGQAPQKLIEDFIEVVLVLKDTKEKRVLKVPMIYIPPTTTKALK